MKRFFATGILFILLIGITSLAPAPKYKYTSSEAKLSVTFPAEFTTENSGTEEYSMVKTQAIDGDMVFFVTYSIYDDQFDDSKSDPLLDVSVDAFTEALGAEVQEKSEWTVNKKVGTAVMLNSDENDLTGEYRVIFLNKTQFQITAIAKKNAWDAKKAKKFFKSFKVEK